MMSIPHDVEVPERSIDLEPSDWLWVTWRERDPRPRPKTKPYNPADAAKRLAKVTDKYGYTWRWRRSRTSISMEPAEAEFWFRAMTSQSEQDLWGVDAAERRTFIATLPQELSEQEFKGELSLAEARDGLAYTSNRVPARVLQPLFVLLSLEELADLLWDVRRFSLTRLLEGAYRTSDSDDQSWRQRRLADKLMEGFRTYVLPYLTEEEIARMRGRIPDDLSPHDELNEMAFRLAAALGKHDLVARAVAACPEVEYWRPNEIIFGLSSAGAVEREMRRLGHTLKDAEQVRAWLALTGLSAIDIAYRSAREKEDGEMVEALGLVSAPELAPLMLELRRYEWGRSAARQWLFQHPAQTVLGLLPLVEAPPEGDEGLADAALALVVRMVRQGQLDLIRACLPGMREAVRQRIEDAVEDVLDELGTPFDEETTPAWLTDAMPDAKLLRRGTPDWVGPAFLPAIAVGESCLSDEQATALLAVLRKSDFDGEPHPLVTALKEHASPDVLERFAWALFEFWLEEGGEAREKWAFQSLGLFGGDQSAVRLAPMLRRWPGESLHARAVVGLDVLRNIGTDTALMQINGIAQKLRYKGLKKKAQEAMEAIADDLGLSRDELEDRIVPDCGLDERGGRVFDYGRRQFTFVLTPDMKPNVRDEDGKLRKNLPRPGKRDDDELAPAAYDEWKLIKKQVRDVARIQAARLERALVIERRWPLEEFRRLLVAHPLMMNLVRMLVWATYDGRGQTAVLFRVTEDNSLADVEDEELVLQGDPLVGIVHPLHMTEAQRQAWGELMSDYEIVPPFAQIGREVFRPTEEELSETDVTRFAETKVPGVSLIGALDRMGWTRGSPGDGGWFSGHTRYFRAAEITAVVEYFGAPVGMIQDAEEQAVERCYFVAGEQAHSYWRDVEKIPLGEVDPIAYSEVLRDVSSIVGAH